MFYVLKVLVNEYVKHVNIKPLLEVISRYGMIGSLCHFEVWGQRLKVVVGIVCCC